MFKMLSQEVNRLRSPRVPCGAYGQAPCTTCRALRDDSAVWRGAGYYNINVGSVWCTDLGWTLFMKFDNLGDAFTDDAVGLPNASNWKLSDAHITELIHSSGGSLRFDCGPSTFVVPNWTNLTWPNWPTWQGEWSTTSGDNQHRNPPSQHYRGFMIPKVYRIDDAVPGPSAGHEDDSRGLETMLYPGTYGASGKPCRVHNAPLDYALEYYVVN